MHTMKKIMRAILMVAALGLVSFFAVYISSNNMGVFNPKGIMALAERNLIITATLLMLIVVIPVFILLAVFAWRCSHDLDPFKPLLSNVQPITIQVVALDWKWLFIYPEQNIATVNFVQFPKYTPVNFRITADAPMNSFWIPQLAGQIYAMAGMDTKLHI